MMPSIKFVTTTYGITRAFILLPRAFRWLPIAVDKAELMLAHNKAQLQDIKAGV
jgi:hypothetical protein